MNPNISEPEVGHVFQIDSPHLVTQMIAHGAPIWLFQSPRFYLWDSTCRADINKECVPAYKKWCEENASVFNGFLWGPWVLMRFKFSSRIGKLVRCVATDLSFLGWIRILRGPRKIVLHGYHFSATTMFLLRMLGKELVYIHWGGAPCGGRIEMRLSRFALRLFKHVFVLMRPEEKYFYPIVGSRVSTLSYPNRKYEELDLGMKMKTSNYATPTATLILGCNAWNRAGYADILDRVSPSDGWRKIVCMLNYGDEQHSDLTNAFVKKYSERLGSCFYPWCKVVPYDEYTKILGEAPFYFSPARQQSGLGAIYNSIYQGKALFLRGDNFEWLTHLGVRVVNIDDIKDFSYLNLCKYIPNEKERCRNLEALQRYFTLTASPQKWKMQILKAFCITTQKI